MHNEWHITLPPVVVAAAAGVDSHTSKLNSNSSTTTTDNVHMSQRSFEAKVRKNKQNYINDSERLGLI
jgi:hypothetical protein